MDTKSNAVIALRLSLGAFRTIGVIVVVSCLAVTGLAAAVHGAGASTQSVVFSVDHTNKGDRLPLASRHISSVSPPVVTTLPPIGCDPAFSRVADPKRSLIFG